MNTMREALSQYVAVRRALGTQLREPAVTLGHFVGFLETEGASFIKTDLAVRWAQQSVGVQRATWGRRLSMVRRFAAWLSAFDPRTEVPPRGLIEARHRRNKPYIFPEQTIEQLIAQAARLRSRTGMRAQTYATLIGLLASTGLRPGEALALDMGDVDLHDGVIAIRNTKFGKSRFVPLDSSTRVALAKYAQRRGKLFPQPRTDAFLVSERGTRLSASASGKMFAMLSRAIGLRPVVGRHRIGRGPRLQDLRHTFATTRLVQWYRAGLDVSREMPKLTTYLGHVDVANTYWYIEAVPELLQLATEYCVTRQRGGVR